MDYNQALIEGLGVIWQRERAESQMTLGGLISGLSLLSPDLHVANLVNAHSYRGYYCDLAFELKPGTRQAGELLADCQSAMGRRFEGYKGGSYMMGENTPVWVANYGSCGKRLIAIHADGEIIISDDDDD